MDNECFLWRILLIFLLSFQPNARSFLLPWLKLLLNFDGLDLGLISDLDGLALALCLSINLFFEQVDLLLFFFLF